MMLSKYLFLMKRVLRLKSSFAQKREAEWQPKLAHHCRFFTNSNENGSPGNDSLFEHLRESEGGLAIVLSDLSYHKKISFVNEIDVVLSDGRSTSNALGNPERTSI